MKTNNPTHVGALAGTITPPSTEKATVYFVKPADWADAYIYLMDANQAATGTAYPGDKMTKAEGDKYSFEVPAGTGYIKFTDGTNTDPNRRTENIAAADIVDGRTYEVDFDKPTAGKDNSWAAKWTGGTTPTPTPTPTPGENATIYFIKPSDWDVAYVHLMKDDLSEYGEKYPGYKMTLVEGDKYTFEVPADVGAIKFKNSWAEGAAVENLRTENVLKADIVDGRTYEVDFDKPTAGKDNSWAAKWEGKTESTPTPTPTPDPNAPSVYFVNTAKWADVYAYTFSEETLGGWPGTQMAKTGDQVHGFDVYMINISGTSAGLVFNNGNGTQTSDITYTAGKYYDAQGNEYASLNDVPAPSGLSTNRFLAGEFNGWSATATEFMLKEAGADTCYVELDLEANTTYQFKIVREGTWASAKETLSITDTVSGITFSGSVQDNCTITTKAAGTYVFAFGMETSQLAVTYPG